MDCDVKRTSEWQSGRSVSSEPLSSLRLPQIRRCRLTPVAATLPDWGLVLRGEASMIERELGRLYTESLGRNPRESGRSPHFPVSDGDHLQIAAKTLFYAIQGLACRGPYGNGLPRVLKVAGSNPAGHIRAGSRLTASREPPGRPVVRSTGAPLTSVHGRMRV
jgi:hypothetical protein